MQWPGWNAIEPATPTFHCGGTWRTAIYQINPAPAQYFRMGHGSGSHGPPGVAVWRSVVGTWDSGICNCLQGRVIDMHEECEAAHIALGLEETPQWTGNRGDIPGA